MAGSDCRSARTVGAVTGDQGEGSQARGFCSLVPRSLPTQRYAGILCQEQYRPGRLRLRNSSDLGRIKKFPQNVRGLWTEQEDTWHRPALSPRPLLLSACHLGDTRTLYSACAWTARAAGGGGDTRHASGAVRRAWAGSRGPARPVGSRWNGSDLSTGAEGRGSSFCEWIFSAYSRGKDAGYIRTPPCLLALLLTPLLLDAPRPGLADLQNSVLTFQRDVSYFGIRRPWF